MANFSPNLSPIKNKIEDIYSADFDDFDAENMTNADALMKDIKTYYFLFILFIIIGACLKLDVVWLIAES